MGSSSTQSNAPWDKARPYVENMMASNYNLYNSQQPQYYRAQYTPDQVYTPQQQTRMSSLQNQISGLSKLPGAGAASPYIDSLRQKLSSLQSQGSPNPASGQRVYNSDTVAGPNAISQEASDALLARARGGSDIQRNMESGVANTLRGDYMDPSSNPWLSRTYDQMAGKVSNNVQQQMMMAGREGSGANQTMLTNQLGQLANNIYGQNYQNERQNQMNLYGQAPGLAQSGYNDINQIGKVGQGLQQYQQQLINADKSAFDYAQNAPFQQAQAYSNLLTGGVGQYGNSNTQNNPGVLGTLMGIMGMMG